MNLYHHLKRFRQILQLQNQYIKNRDLEKIRKSSHLVEKLSTNIKAIFLNISNPKFLDKEQYLFDEIRSCYEVNKCLLLSYKDISDQSLNSLKKKQLTYSKDGQIKTDNNIFYSVTA